MSETATLEIRRFRPEDSEAVRSLHRRAIEEVGAYAEELSDYLDRDMEDIEGSYLRSGGDFFVGTLDGAVIAIGALSRVSEAEAEIKRMRIEPDFQRRGFGKTLLKHLEERARELGFTRLKLDTTVRQTGAQQLYEGSGYSVIGRGRIGPFDCLFYAKELA